MSLFKRAACRGVAHELVSRGLCSFPSKEAADEAADAVADGPIGGQLPEVSGPEGHGPEQLEEVARKLIEIAEALMAEAHGAAGAPPGGEAPPVKAAAEQLKVAASRDLATIASEVAVACMDKAAAETKQAGDPKLVGVGKSEKNDLGHSAGHDSTAALDKKNRPEGKYLAGKGQTGLDTSSGQIGSSKAPTVAPSKSPSGSNSVTEGTKGASLRDLVEKQANKLVGLHSAPANNLANSPDSVAKLDAKNRPEGAYLVGQGNANIKTPAAAHIGVETKPTVAPTQSPGGSNSVTEASKAASEEAAYVAEFEKCATDVGPYLPATLTVDEKIAAINTMIPLDHNGRQAKLNELHAKVASECKECKGDVKCEKHGGKKEASLLDRVREIAAKVTVSDGMARAA